MSLGHGATSGFGRSVTFSRPADTTAYAALDVVGASTGSAINQFLNTCAPGQETYIISAELVIGGTTVITGMAGFRLHLYSSSPTAIADNAPFDLVSADRARYLTYLEFETPVDLGSTLFARCVFPGGQIKPESPSLWGILQTVGAFTPESGTSFEVRIHNMRA